MQSWPSPTVPEIDGSGPALRLFDTADALVKPVAPGPVATMYVCGITPYDATHLGHAATYLAFDTVHRVLRDQGHEVHYVQNITDVDDPLFERAARDGIDWRELGARETDLFRSDMANLRILPPRDYIGAVESVGEVIEAVGALLESGAAYVVDDPDHPDIYFRSGATGVFGYESNYDRATMEKFFAERGGDPDRPGKHDPIDALVWRAARPGEPSWDAPFGAGRPGWHIECSVIALNRLGQSFDIQGGGSDLIFPHHEYSAAHGEALAQQRRFARHYVHTGMIGLDGEKMSKSLGNLVLVSKLRAAGIDPRTIRLGLLDGHYRADRMWTDGALDVAAGRLTNWQRAVARASGPEASAVIDRVRTHLANDLDTPKALTAIDGWAASALAGIGSAAQAPGQIADVVDALLGVDLRAAPGPDTVG